MVKGGGEELTVTILMSAPTSGSVRACLQRTPYSDVRFRWVRSAAWQASQVKTGKLDASGCLGKIPNRTLGVRLGKIPKKGLDHLASGVCLG